MGGLCGIKILWDCGVSELGASILDLKHSKTYEAKIRKPESHMENAFGYNIIKLEQDFNFTVYRNEHKAFIGQYLAQYRFAPMGYPAPIILDNWQAVRSEFHVFNKAGNK